MGKIENVKWAALILAAGKGKRMQSPLPKVLHEVKGKPILEWVVLTLQATQVARIGLVLGENFALFKGLLDKYPELVACQQRTQKGTADAVAAVAGNFLHAVSVPSFSQGQLLRGLPIVSENILICLGDIPGIKSETMQDFLDAFEASGAGLGLIGMQHPNPFGYGRLLVNDEGELQKVVEERDASESEKNITLCNTGIVAAKTRLLFDLLCEITPNNEQQEYYLTDCFALARQEQAKVFVFETKNYQEFNGVNNPEQLNAINAWFEQSRGV